jgi:hypothetical protein
MSTGIVILGAVLQMFINVSNSKKGGWGLTGLTKPHLCACPKLGKLSFHNTNEMISVLINCFV